MIGTNVTIVTLALALGLSALIFPLSIDRRARRQALIATRVSILLVVVLFLGVATRLEGVLLLVVFVGYTLFLFRTDREAVTRGAEGDDEEEEDDDQQKPSRPHLGWKPVLLSFGGLAAMAVGGPAIVEGALRFAQIVGLRQSAVGATIVSLGTGAEMIALGVSAARKKRADLLIGGILGSFAYNLLVTLGLAAAIHPLSVDPPMAFLALPVMVVVHLMLLTLVWYGKIPRLMGGLLVGSYLAYLLLLVLA